MKYVFFLFISIFMMACQPKKSPPMPRTKSPQGTLYDIYVGTYTEKEDFVNGKGEGIYNIQLDCGLNEVGRSVIKGIKNPSFLALSYDNKYLYAVEELNPNGNIYSYNTEYQDVKQLSRVSSHGGSPCHIALNYHYRGDGQENLLMSANYMGGNVAIFEIKNGVLSEAIDSLKFEGKGKTARQDASHPHEVVYFQKATWSVPDLGLDQIHNLELNNGKLKKWANRYDIAPGAGPRHIVENRYLLNELNSTIIVYTDESKPKKLQTISTLPSDYKGSNLTAEIQATKDFVYASNRGHNSIAMYKKRTDGTLENIGYEPSRGEFPRNFNISPDGKYLFCGNQNSDNIVIFSIKNDGKLAFVKEIKVNTPVCILFKG